MAYMTKNARLSPKVEFSPLLKEKHLSAFRLFQNTRTPENRKKWAVRQMQRVNAIAQVLYSYRMPCDEAVVLKLEADMGWNYAGMTHAHEKIVGKETWGLIKLADGQLLSAMRIIREAGEPGWELVSALANARLKLDEKIEDAGEILGKYVLGRESRNFKNAKSGIEKFALLLKGAAKKIANALAPGGVPGGVYPGVSPHKQHIRNGRD